MAKTFVINGKTYTSKPFDFNLVCDFEENGLNIDTMMEKPLSLSRAFLSACSGMSTDASGLEIQNHLANGGTFDDILEVITYEVENSDFFLSLSKTEEKETPKRTSAKKKAEV